MKKIHIALFAAVLALACTPETEEYQPDTTLYTSGTVNLCASIEELQTKMVMDLTGRGIWSEGDKIAVACSDGSFVEFELNGTGETKRAIFTGDIPAGKTLGKVAVWPANAVVGIDGDNLTVKTPAEYSIDNIAYDGIMVANITDSWEITFRHIMARPTFKINNVPTFATHMVMKADGCSLGGRMTMDVNEDGIVAEKGPQSLTLELNTEEPSSSVTFTVNMPVADYKEITVDIYEGDNLITSQVLNENIVSLYRASMSSVSARIKGSFEKFDPVDVQYIEVAGIKWAKGNLQFEKDGTETGFRPNWRLSPKQWHYYEYEETEAYKVKHDGGTANGVAYSESNPTRQDLLNDYTRRYDHFNFGGISSPWSRLNVNHAQCLGLDISGKMYMDTECTQEAEAFVDATHGDIAYWASNGYYRMPKFEEYETLLDEAVYYAGYYMTPDKVKVWGSYFRNPVEGETPGMLNTSVNEIKDADLEKGVFLPNAGRKAFATDEYCINARANGFYWASFGGSEKSDNSSYLADFYATMFVFEISAKNAVSYKLWTTADSAAKGSYNRRNCYSIRPVVNDAKK